MVGGKDSKAPSILGRYPRRPRPAARQVNSDMGGAIAFCLLLIIGEPEMSLLLERFERVRRRWRGEWMDRIVHTA